MGKWGTQQPPLTEEELKEAMDDSKAANEAASKRRQFMRMIVHGIAPVAVSAADRLFGPGDQREDMLDLLQGLVAQTYMGTDEDCLLPGETRADAIKKLFAGMIDHVDQSNIAGVIKKAPRGEKNNVGKTVSRMMQMSALQLMILTIDEQLELAFNARKASPQSFFFSVNVVGKEAFQKFYKDTADYLLQKGQISQELAKAIQETDWKDGEKFMDTVMSMKGKLSEAMDELLDKLSKGEKLQ